jgi:hypothetical protein
MGTHCSLGSHRITAEDGIEHCTVLGNQVSFLTL